METRNGLYVCLTVGHLSADDSSSETVGGSDPNFADAYDASGDREGDKNASYLFPQSQQ